jgi:hypothetical protein
MKAKELIKQVKEKLGKDADAGDYIKDFRKSDAPQFKGKSDKKIQKMAIAAYLDSKEEVDIQELINYDRQLKDPKKETMIMSKKDGKPFVIDKKDEKKWLRQGYVRVEEVDLDEDIKGYKPHVGPRDTLSYHLPKQKKSMKAFFDLVSKHPKVKNVKQEALRGRGGVVFRLNYDTDKNTQIALMKELDKLEKKFGEYAGQTNVVEEVDLEETDLKMFVQEKIIARFDDAKGDFEVEIPSTKLNVHNFDPKKLGDYIHSVVKKKAGRRMKDFLGYKVESKNPHINAYVKAISDANRTEVEESLMSTMYNKLIKTVRKMPKDQFVRKYVGTHMFPGADKMSKNDLEDIWKIWNGQESNDLEEGGEGSGPQKGDKRGQYDTKGHTTDKPKGFFAKIAQKYIDRAAEKEKEREKRRKYGAIGALDMGESKMGALFLDIQTDAQDTDISKQEFVRKWTREAHLTRQEAERMWTEFQEETKVEEKEINPYVEATSLAIKAAARALGEKPIDPADIDDLATDDDRKAADKNIIIQLRRAQDMGGKADVTFLDNPRKKMKIDIKIINKALEMFDKMRPNDKARMQSTISKSYRGLLDTVKRGRV